MRNQVLRRHISFYCMTDNEEGEACDLRLFQIDKEKTLMEDNDYGWE